MLFCTVTVNNAEQIKETVPLPVAKNTMLQVRHARCKGQTVLKGKLVD